MRVTTYPLWNYFPRNVRAPAWVGDIVQVVAAAERDISTQSSKASLDSNGVLLRLADGLRGVGYQVERGKAASEKISRPVLFGEQGRPDVTMEIDAFHDVDGVAVEVEAGRAWNGNAVYRDLVRSSLLLDARHLALLLPIAYAPPSARAPIPAYANACGLVDAIYASQRLRLPFEGILLIGY
jgi:hypothetical protein